jgi:hypothetical protein
MQQSTNKAISCKYKCVFYTDFISERRESRLDFVSIYIALLTRILLKNWVDKNIT